MTTYKSGDVVRLRSGGPRMTVTEPPVADISGYHCVWFDDSNVHHSHYFAADVLTLAGTVGEVSPSEPGHFDTIA